MKVFEFIILKDRYKTIDYGKECALFFIKQSKHVIGKPDHGFIWLISTGFSAVMIVINAYVDQKFKLQILHAQVV